MIRGLNPVAQGVLGTIFTWFITALGAAVVFIFPSTLSKKTEGVLLDACLGFSAGVMLAASYWSLLDPAIELADVSGYGLFSFLPASIGFAFGALTVWTADKFLPDTDDIGSYLKEKPQISASSSKQEDIPASVVSETSMLGSSGATLRQRKSVKAEERTSKEDEISLQQPANMAARSWRRVLLLVIAMTIHNFPEGLAVGVAFGSIGKAPSATFEAATILAIGIGLQNFPEGLAVSLPMHREKRSKLNSFFWGQMSGAVEPIGGFIGAIAVEYAESFLPYALGFAAGAMIYVVIDSIIPEAQVRGNSTQASWGAIFGFLLMMSMDVALG